MSLLYRLVQRLNPLNRSAAPRWFAEAVSRGIIDVEQLLDAVCEDTTLNREEARMAINRAFKKVEDFLLLGFRVRLGEMGYIHLTTKSTGVEQSEDATATMIKDIVPRFVFGRKFRENIKRVKVERVAK